MRERISQIMQSQNMTQRDFAAALGISPSSLSSIFNGHTSPTNYTVQAIHRRFPQINITWLMFGEGEMMTKGDETDIQNPSQGSQDKSVGPMIQPDRLNSDNGENLQKDDDDLNKGNVIIRETVKYIDKPQRRITEIHVFYDDGTFETFSGRRD